jgi:hypothetical protein
MTEHIPVVTVSRSRVSLTLIWSPPGKKHFSCSRFNFTTWQSLQNKEIPYRHRYHQCRLWNWCFYIFLFCFVIYSIVIGKKEMLPILGTYHCCESETCIFHRSLSDFPRSFGSGYDPVPDFKKKFRFLIRPVPVPHFQKTSVPDPTLNILAYSKRYQWVWRAQLAFKTTIFKDSWLIEPFNTRRGIRIQNLDSRILIRIRQKVLDPCGKVIILVCTGTVRFWELVI